MFKVHQEPLYRRYHAPWNSWAVFYSVVFAFVLIILPLIIAYNSYGNITPLFFIL
ncbi:hypothetical protein EON65_04170 [archaeon]|nr:MAG: hypothetical protein EON65_04170 [archaeon]